MFSWSYLVLSLVLLASGAFAQQRYFVRVNDPSAANFLQTLNGSGVNFVLIRQLDYTRNGMNAVVLDVNPTDVPALRQVLTQAYGQPPRLFVDEVCRPDEGSGDPIGAPIEAAPAAVNGALDYLWDSAEVPLEPKVPGDVLVDIVGTGVDYAHPAFAPLTLAPALSVMPASGGGDLPADVDLHNHETRLLGCVAGAGVGLLDRLGMLYQPRYRSVLCYEVPVDGEPASTFASDAIAAVGEVLTDRETRVAQPYLKNHAAVMCFAHSVLTAGTRVGDLDAILDEAWEAGVVTVISAGNRNAAAATNSPSGAGQWIVSGAGSERYWPSPGGVDYALPAVADYDGGLAGGGYHVVAGAHDVGAVPALWSVGAGLGSNFNVLNDDGFVAEASEAVDFFAPGQGVPCTATRLSLPAAPGDTTALVDGVEYKVERGYQVGNGTSYSAAFATAVATRIVAMSPWAKPEQVKAQMESVMTASGSVPSFDLMRMPTNAQLTPIYLTYDEWIELYEGRAEAAFGTVLAKDDDPDGDGVVNLVEYACGMDPRHADAHLAPVVVYDEDSSQLDIAMHCAAYLDPDGPVKWRIESSVGLDMDWVDEGQGTVTELPATAMSGDGYPITSEFAVTGMEVKQFFRVRVYEEE